MPLLEDGSIHQATVAYVVPLPQPSLARILVVTLRSGHTVHAYDDGTSERATTVERDRTVRVRIIRYHQGEYEGSLEEA